MSMKLKTLRQALKVLAEDTRLRIVNILNYREITVNEICSVLGINQSAASKHLVRLRLLRTVVDRRVKNFVYYSLNLDSEQNQVLRFILSKFEDLEVFKKDRIKLNKIKQKKHKKGGEHGRASKG